jgi:hypothetical protein
MGHPFCFAAREKGIKAVATATDPFGDVNKKGNGRIRIYRDRIGV